MNQKLLEVLSKDIKSGHVSSVYLSSGAGAPQGVLNFLAKAAVAASYSGSSTAAAAAASRNTFAAWAERVQQDPQGAAYKVSRRYHSTLMEIIM